ncbi:MAG: hypothetical protein J5940_00260 [Clostridia bacterium]|nr:hypothetical protein [Clostridia bacterium]
MSENNIKTGNAVFPGEETGPAIGEREIAEAASVLESYKSAKANLEKRITENEKWYRLRHWECMRDRNEEIEPVSAWLFNCIMNKHADCMDNMPSVNVLPREKSDRDEARALGSIIPVILDQNDFEGVYSGIMTRKLRGGTGVYGVFWDAEKQNGIGDISVCDVDVLNLYWEPGITDIQKSKNLFHVELKDNDELSALYPQLAGRLGESFGVARYLYDESIDTSNKTAVVDWYYKKRQNGRTVLHFCKFCNGRVLYATENDTEPVFDAEGNAVRPPLSETGLYAHGKYPFVFDVLFPVEGMPTGFGYIDIGKDSQQYIDRGNQAVMKNLLVSARPRYFIRSDGAVKEEEYADIKNDFIHVDGNLGQDSITPVSRYPLDPVYVTVLRDRIDELKETTGNRDVTTGGTVTGVTAASAIAAMQEAGSKITRDMNKASYRAFRSVVLMMIELIRQFYDLPRRFRITGDDASGGYEFITYGNGNIKPASARGEGYPYGETPLFDVEITAQKQSPYSKMSQNELALSLYKAGMFAPQAADQAAACLDMMDFDRKQFVLDKVIDNGGMYKQMLRMQQALLDLAEIIDGEYGTGFAEEVAAQVIGSPAKRDAANVSGVPKKDEKIRLGVSYTEPKRVKLARENALKRSEPR